MENRTYWSIILVLKILFEIILGQIWAVTVTPDSRYVVSGCEDQSIRVFDIETRQLVQNFDKIHTDPVSHIAITSDGKYLISATLNTIKTIELNLDNSQGGDRGYLEQETFVCKKNLLENFLK